MTTLHERALVMPVLLAGLLGWCVGKALGVPIWRQWEAPNHD